jgi:high-affinity iron transporter
MLLNAVVIVLRETLEAGVLLSLLLTIANARRVPVRWMLLAFVAGVCCAAAYASQLGTISLWFDYTGQELVNASIQYAIYFCLCGISLLAFVPPPAALPHPLLHVLLALTVTLATVREGAEIILFFSSYLQGNGALSRALTSGFIGLMIGLSAGALVYFAIQSLPKKVIPRVQLVLVALLAAGMVAQATQLLIQADWLPSALPLWDSGALLDEQSTLGQLAYAVFGYETTPTALEFGVYMTALLALPLAVMAHRSRQKLNKELMLQ